MTPLSGPYKLVHLALDFTAVRHASHSGGHPHMVVANFAQRKTIACKCAASSYCLACLPLPYMVACPALRRAARAPAAAAVVVEEAPRGRYGLTPLPPLQPTSWLKSRNSSAADLVRGCVRRPPMHKWRYASGVRTCPACCTQCRDFV